MLELNGCTPATKREFLAVFLKYEGCCETLPAEESPTRQHGWLDCAYGVWHLVLEEDDHPVRCWGDKDSALAELAGEGWLVIGPFPRRYRRRWVFDRTYSLIRFV